MIENGTVCSLISNYNLLFLNCVANIIQFKAATETLEKGVNIFKVNNKGIKKSASSQQESRKASANRQVF